MPTATQLKFMKNALFRPTHRFLQPATVDNRYWMIALVQMDEKGFVRWEGPRPFLSARGRAAITTAELTSTSQERPRRTPAAAATGSSQPQP